MSHTLPLAQRSASTRRARLAASLTVAIWRLRQTWLLLLLTSVGLLAALIIACIMPLFSTVISTASLQNILQGSATRNDLMLNVTMQGLSTSSVSTLQQQLANPLQQTFAPYQSELGPLTIQESFLSIVEPRSLQSVAPLQLYATSLERLQPRLHLVAGRLPASRAQTPDSFEVALTPQAAQELHLALGAQLKLQSQFVTLNQKNNAVHPSALLTAKLVGLFQVQPASVSFLHGQDFQPIRNNGRSTYTLLASAPALLSTLDQMAARAQSSAIFSYQSFQLTWEYSLHTSNVQPGQLDDLINRLSLAQTQVGNSQGDGQQIISGWAAFPYLTQAHLYNPAPGSFQLLDLLLAYSSRTSQVSIPLTVLALQIVALLLFFVCLLMTMLFERQVTANALLSSRGASNGQIFWSLALQGLLLCLFSALLAPLASVTLVGLLARYTLASGIQASLRATLAQPLQVLATIAPTGGGTLLATLLALGLLIRTGAHTNTLTLRRETSRGTRRPFWLRYYLDVLAALVALSAYVVSLSLASVADSLDTTTQDLILAPLTLIAPIFLLLGVLLLFLRVFPWLLRLAGHAASRGRSATSMLALVQIARSPRQVTRMTLLLTLTIAFAVFAQVFNASQIQRTSAISAYEAGADFSGDLPTALSTQSMTRILAQYRALPGVQAASADFSDTGTALGPGDTPLAVQFRAIDTRSFASTVIWNTQDSSQPLSQLLTLLPQVKKARLSSDNPTGLLIPALLDQALANLLNVKAGDTFSVTLNDLQQSTLAYQVAAVVAHIPMVNSSTAASTTGSPGGLLADYQAFVQAYNTSWQLQQQQQSLVQKAQGKPALILPTPAVPLNHLWLHSSDNASDLVSLRVTLGTAQLALARLYDRRTIAAEMQSDPFNLNILVILGVGGLAAFLLAFIGNVLSSWVSVRTRLSNFVVLRAMGATSRQIAGILLWEQGIIYLGSLALGLAFGAILASVSVPILVFTSLPAHGPLSTLNSADFTFLQHALPAQIVVPLSLDLSLATLILICLAALGIMLRTVFHSSISSELRVNED